VNVYQQRGGIRAAIRTIPATVPTIEDPIEYLQGDDQAVVTQREVGADTLSFSPGRGLALPQFWVANRSNGSSPGVRC
jgi:Tfp pilus assembly pilus retraction ATPase PilT